jgi:hypothetical protein
MSDQTIETIFTEDRRYPPPPDFAAEAVAQPDIYERDFDEFWESEGRERVTWFEPFTKLYEWELPYAKRYLGGKLNVSYNCLDRHVDAGLGDRAAYLWEGEPEGERREITRPASGRAVRFANALKELGVGQGDGSRPRWGWSRLPMRRAVRAPRRAAHRRSRWLLRRLLSAARTHALGCGGPIRRTRRRGTTVR